MLNENKRDIIGTVKPVLDHGFVRLIDFMGSDQRVVESARISYKSPSKGEEKDAKLLKFLYENNHWSPFEQCNITFNIKLPIFVMRQLVRHRTARINEVSARYTELPDEFYIPDSWRRQDTKNKQGSIDSGFWNPIVIGEEDNSENVFPKVTATELFEWQCKQCYSVYKDLLNSGISREMARMILPVNIYTEIYWNIDLRNLLNFIRLREDSHAQAEIQEYSKAIKFFAKELFPVTMGIYEEALVKTTNKYENSKNINSN